MLLLALLILGACAKSDPQARQDLSALSWSDMLDEARGQEVTMMMWLGDPLINRYMNEYVIPTVRDSFGIQLQTVPGQGVDVVSTLMKEIEAGKGRSALDMGWINGETFYQLRQINALYGPFVERLPNSRYLDMENPFIGYDFQQPVDGYECPWGNVQMALIYNSRQVQQPPGTLEELEQWVQANPGKFTIGTDFTGMTLLKAWMIDLAGGRDALRGDFSAEKYARYSAALWDYVNRIKPYLWNQGESFPQDVAQMHQLYINGELWFTMSNNDAEVDNKIERGVFNEDSRAYVPEFGTIQNSHYLGIVKHSASRAAAMVVANFLISPEAQFRKLQPAIWGDGTVLAREKLPARWQDKFANVPGRQYAPDRSEIKKKALMEPAPEYMIRLYEDFRKVIVEGGM